MAKCDTKWVNFYVCNYASTYVVIKETPHDRDFNCLKTKKADRKEEEHTQTNKDVVTNLIRSPVILNAAPVFSFLYCPSLSLRPPHPHPIKPHIDYASVVRNGCSEVH